MSQKYPVKITVNSGGMVTIWNPRDPVTCVVFTVEEAAELREQLIWLFNSDNPQILKAERDMWKRRAAQHGCNVEEGDDCG